MTPEFSTGPPFSFSYQTCVNPVLYTDQPRRVFRERGHRGNSDGRRGLRTETGSTVTEDGHLLHALRAVSTNDTKELILHKLPEHIVFHEQPMFHLSNKRLGCVTQDRHTHARAHTHRRARTYPHGIDMHTHTRARTYTHTQTHARTHARTHAHTRTHTAVVLSLRAVDDNDVGTQDSSSARGVGSAEVLRAARARATQRLVHKTHRLVMLGAVCSSCPLEGRNPTHTSFLPSLFVECCFTSTETVGVLVTGLFPAVKRLLFFTKR